MAASLAQVLRQLARKKAEARDIKRVEVIGVLPDGTHLLASGQVAKVSGRAEFRVGEIVDVLPVPAPLILGHKWQKGDVPSVRVRQAVEEVEEIIMTEDSHPEGGRALDFFLRSWQGLFYLDFRAAVSAVVTDPSTFLDTFVPPGSRFPIQCGEHVRFGANDNTIGVIVISPNDQFGVIYVFKIDRPLHSNWVPVSGDPYVLGGVEYPRVALTLLALYDLSTMQVPTDVTIHSVGSVLYQQGYYDLLVLRTGTWNPSPPGGYDIDPDVVQSFAFSTPVVESFPFDETVSVIIDFSHWQDIASGSLHPYQWDIEHFWVGPGDQPFLVVAVEHTGRFSPLFNRVARDDSGAFVPAQDLISPPFDANAISPASIPIDEFDLAEQPALVMRLDLADGLVGGAMIARSCPASLVLTSTVDYTDNVPQTTLPGAFGNTLLGTHTVQQVLGGGGPTDGTTFIRATDFLFGVLSVDPGLPPFGSATTTQQRPGAYGSTLPKEVLRPFFGTIPSVGSLGSAVWYIVVSGVLAEFTHTINGIGLVGELPGGELWAVRDALCRPKSLTDLDILLRRGQVEASHAWRIQDGLDALVLYPTGSVGIGIINKPHAILNRDFVLFEGSRLCGIDGSSVVHFPVEFGPAAGSIFALVAPDRLYDERDSVGKFRSTTDPTIVLGKPKPLPSFEALVPFTLFLSTPVPDIIHTVGSRTDKVSG